MELQQKTEGPTDLDLIAGYKYIVLRAGYLGGKPSFKNRRISVSQVLSAMAEGMTIQELQDTYEVTPEMVAETLAYAATLAEEKKCG